MVQITLFPSDLTKSRRPYATELRTRLVVLLIVGSAVMALALTAPATGHAGSLCICEASVGCGNVRHIPSPAIGVVLDIDYDPRTAEYGVIYGMGEVLIEVTGELVIDAFACELTACTPAFGGPGSTSLQVTGGDALVGIPGLGDLGLLTISGPVGYVNVVSGRYFDGFFIDRLVPFTTLAIVSEPAELVLVTLSLASLLLLRLRRTT
jgi:hypothetical protein